jgi:adenylyltransferase/sulfurtransferase
MSGDFRSQSGFNTPVADGDGNAVRRRRRLDMPIGRATSELPELSEEETLRYGRHLVIPELGRTGQRRLKDARILMVGAGGLGSPIGLYLAAAGVGTLGIVEFDTVEATNLQRQILHGTKDVGRRKVDTARDRIHDVNPNVKVIGHDTRLEASNALELIRAYDLVVDATDNLATRYLTNDACVRLGKPNVYGSVFRFEGQASVFCAKDGPCFRCLHREPPPPGVVPSSAEAGILGVLPGLIGVVQATEAVKLVTGIGQPLVGRLLHVDALQMSFRTVKLRRDPDCPTCGRSGDAVGAAPV